ncbi:class II aldolase/adducin family protein [Psychrobacillus sp. FSL H8-0484]|uniref:class II aldolase/adducin family protein n=1 Tax=Psychrobacillus sp. FSL H8-0484 TaxID=2921390 RepID=UPI0030F7823D
MVNQPFIIPGESNISKLVNRSKLLGIDPNLVLYGGGNTSSKMEEIDHLGRRRTILRIKGSGCDLKTITEQDFSGLYLEELLPLLELDSMSDEDMVDYLANCMVSAAERRPSIETLLHAFIDALHVDHVHSDAICTLTNHENAEEIIHEILGNDVAFVPYYRPGFKLSKVVQQFSNSYAVVLEHHGLVTWGNTHEESYLKTIELEEKAKAYINSHKSKKETESQEKLTTDKITKLLLRLRGQLSQKQKQIITIDENQLNIANRKDVEQIATGGRSTLEHILRIGKDSLVISENDDCKHAIQSYRERYTNFFIKFQSRLPKGYDMHDNIDPKVGLIPGVGCFGAGISLDNAKRNIEIARHSHEAIANVLDIFHASKNLTEEEVFDIDYWPLELYKLTLSPAVPNLAGYIFIVIGINNPQEELMLKKLLKKGAHIVAVADYTENLSAMLDSYKNQIKLMDGNHVEQAIQKAILHYGGLDGVIIGGNAALSKDQVIKINEVFEMQEMTGFILKTNESTLNMDEHHELNSTSIINATANQTALEGILSILGN